MTDFDRGDIVVLSDAGHPYNHAGIGVVTERVRGHDSVTLRLLFPSNANSNANEVGSYRNDRVTLRGYRVGDIVRTTVAESACSEYPLGHQGVVTHVSSEYVDDEGDKVTLVLDNGEYIFAEHARLITPAAAAPVAAAAAPSITLTLADLPVGTKVRLKETVPYSGLRAPREGEVVETEARNAIIVFTGDVHRWYYGPHRTDGFTLDKLELVDEFDIVTEGPLQAGDKIRFRSKLAHFDGTIFNLGCNTLSAEDFFASGFTEIEYIDSRWDTSDGNLRLISSDLYFSGVAEVKTPYRVNAGRKENILLDDFESYTTDRVVMRPKVPTPPPVDFTKFKLMTLWRIAGATTNEVFYVRTEGSDANGVRLWRIRPNGDYTHGSIYYMIERGEIPDASVFEPVFSPNLENNNRRR